MHKSVLLNETIEFLNIKPDGYYVDGTLGLGGHAEAIARRLGPNGRLLGLDVDPHNLAAAERRLQPLGDLTRTRQVNFRGLHGALTAEGWKGADGMLFDLGVASPQLDNAERGMSFQSDGPLDMRLDPTSGKTAQQILRTIRESDLEELLREFGEERNARKLSKSILFELSAGRLNTTGDLARLCERVIGRHGKTHPATRVFLALRCLVNDELGALDDLLATAPDCLNVGGRLVFISFHSLEDKRVKERFRSLACLPDRQVKEPAGAKRFSLVTKKPVVPSDQEQRENSRARSAKLRVLERTA